MTTPSHTDGTPSILSLKEMLRWRAVPLAGLFIVVTAKCPLRCAHCSTESLMSSPDARESQLLAFLQTLGVDGAPKFLLLTGGEPLLQPMRVRQIVSLAHAAGTSVSLLTGLFFAAKGGGVKPPPSVEKAIRSLDHLTVSLDTFHEAQVSHENVMKFFSWATERLDIGLSVQITEVPGDGYAERAVEDLSSRFGNRIEVFRGSLRPVGRAKGLNSKAGPAPRAAVKSRGCSMLSWPVVRVDGQVVRCCSYSATEPSVPPPHLLLGDIQHDDWASLRSRFYEPAVISAIRTCGPVFLQRALLKRELKEEGYCQSCASYDQRVGDEEVMQAFTSRPLMKVLRSQLDAPELHGNDKDG